ncbi:NAD(P)H-dependent oxidoreductase subunit E [Vallitalea okinawensis]|uniref:NAD(P)H-dependent oxidoreductase subunit E n=1 Tax=Vallitalea okinawensis TaxID=2078660 RepID=UPI000CFD2E52|nr:NAD(P)H-dependent oxidoreductase subunit E [Vallitalea okinawensis]
MLTIYVCIGSACHLKGSYDVINGFQEQVKAQKLDGSISINAAFCLGHCTEAVSVKIDDEIHSVTPDIVEDFFNKEVLRRLD